MDLVPPVAPAQWHDFLRAYSTEFMASAFFRSLESEGRGDVCVDPAQRRTGWLGYSPASSDAITTVEQRLGVSLPPTYRNFLLTTDGFSTISYACDLLPAARIGWFRSLEAELLGAWSTPDMDFFAAQADILRRCLLISDDDGGAGHYLLLDPGDSTPAGEWRAYEWWPGDGEDPEPYDNFAVLVTSLWAQANR
jgi:hypothetical protein